MATAEAIIEQDKKAEEKGKEKQQSGNILQALTANRACIPAPTCTDEKVNSIASTTSIY